MILANDLLGVMRRNLDVMNAHRQQTCARCRAVQASDRRPAPAGPARSVLAERYGVNRRRNRIAAAIRLGR